MKFKVYMTIWLVLNLMLCVFCVSAQDNEKEYFTSVPINQVMPVIVSQTECPIKVENFVIGKDTDGHYMRIKG